MPLADTADTADIKWSTLQAMPLAGRNLQEVIMSERLPSEPIEAVRLVCIQIANTIADLHALGLAHGEFSARVRPGTGLNTTVQLG